MTKEEVLSRMLDRNGGGDKVLQRGTMVLDWSVKDDKFYLTFNGKTEPITDEEAVRVYETMFVVSGEHLDEVSVVEVDFIEDRGIDTATLATLSSVQFDMAYIELIRTIDRLTDIKKRVDEKAKSLIKEQYLIDGQNKVESESFNMTLIPESFRERFDLKAFAEAEPELYAELEKKYTAISKVSDSLRITRKRKRGE